MPYRSVTSRGIDLLCFPPYDVVFARLVARESAGLPSPEPDALRNAIRLMYPGAVVRERERIASLHDSVAWYVYRDGRYSPFTDEQPWWEEPGVARLEIDEADGRYRAANESAQALVGVDEATLRTLRVGELTDSSARSDVEWVWELLRDVGVVHSTSILAAPDGRRIPIEYRTVRDGAGPGVAVSFLRAVPIDAAAPSPDPVDPAT